MKVQILIDNRYRDFLTAYLIKRYVEAASNHQVYLSNKINYVRLFHAINPDIIILPHTSSYLRDLVPEFAETADVYVLPSEGGVAEEGWILEITERLSNRENNKKYLKRVYTWGEEVKRVFQKNSVYRDEQMLVSGNPRFDLYRTTKTNGDLGSKKCVFASTLRLSTNIYNATLPSIIKNLSSLNRDDPVYWNEGGQLADTIWYEAAFLEVLKYLWGELKEKNIETSFSLRPHPFESEEQFAVFQEIFDMSLCKKDPLIRVLEDAYVYIMSCSTSGADAMMAGVPALTLDLLFDSSRRDLLMPTRLMKERINFLVWRPKTFDEACELIAKAKAGDLPLSPDEEGLDQFFKEYYNYLDGVFATQIVGDDLINALSSRSTNNRVDVPKLMTYCAKEIASHVFHYKEEDMYYSPYRKNDKRIKSNLDPNVDEVLGKLREGALS